MIDFEIPQTLFSFGVKINFSWVLCLQSWIFDFIHKQLKRHKCLTKFSCRTKQKMNDLVCTYILKLFYLGFPRYQKNIFQFLSLAKNLWLHSRGVQTTNSTLGTHREIADFSIKINFISALAGHCNADVEIIKIVLFGFPTVSKESFFWCFGWSLLQLTQVLSSVKYPSLNLQPVQTSEEAY